MSDLPPPTTPTSQATSPPPAYRSIRRWLIPVVTLLVGAGLGFGIGNATNSDDTQTAATTATTAGSEATAPAATEANDSPSTTAVSDTTDEPESTEAQEATTVPPTEATTQAPVVEGGEPTCAYTGTNFLRNMQVELIFANTLGDVPSLAVTYALLDADGGPRFFTGREPITLARANEHFRISASTIEEVPPNIDEATIGCRVLAIEEGSGALPFQSPTDADICTVQGVDSSGGIQIELAVTSPFDDTRNVHIFYALQAPGPVRFETRSAKVDLFGAGESVRISEDTRTEMPGWIGDGEVTCAVLGVWDG